MDNQVVVITGATSGIGKALAEACAERKCRLVLGARREELLEEVIQAFHKEPNHKCKGRAAPGRLERALSSAENCGIDVPVLKRIKGNLINGA